MAPQVLDTQFLLNLRVFCKFVVGLKSITDFHGNCLRALKAGQFKDSFDYLKDRVKFDDELKKENFVLFCFRLFTEFNNCNFMNAQLHLDKENFVIVDCLNILLIPVNLPVEYNISNNEMDIFRIIHSKLISVFNFNGETLLENFFNKKFNEKFDSMLRNRDKNEDYFNDIDKFLNFDINGKKLLRNFNKFLRYNNHIDILNFHKSNNTTPKCLFYSQHPYPFFIDSESFVEKHNQLIEKHQQEFMDLIICELNERIDKLKDENENIKLELSNNTNNLKFEIEDLFRRAENLEEKDLKEVFLKSKYKAERCKNVKYVAKKSSDSENSQQQSQQFKDAYYYKNLSQNNNLNQSLNNSNNSQFERTSNKNVSFGNSSFRSNSNTRIDNSFNNGRRNNNFNSSFSTKRRSNGPPSILKNKFNNNNTISNSNSFNQSSSNFYSNSNSTKFSNGQAKEKFRWRRHSQRKD